MDEYNLSEWANQQSTKFFLSLVNKNIENLKEVLLMFTEQESISKDYFKTVGQIEGLKAIFTIIDNNKKGE